MKHATLALASLALTFAMLEGGVRLLIGPVVRTARDRMSRSLALPSDVPGLHHVLRPNATAVHHFAADPDAYFDPGATLTYRTNSHGFRNREVRLEKPEGVTRVLGLGDSFTFGRGVRREDTFLSRLEVRYLESGRAVEILNLGVTGYDTVNEVTLLRHIGLAFGPDLVVICFYLNDVTKIPVSRFLSRQSETRLPAWRRLSVLFDRLTARVERQLHSRDLIAEYRNAVLEDGPEWQRAKLALTEAAELARTEGFELVLMIFPVLYELSQPSPFTEVHDRIAAFGDRVGIAVLDLLPAFDGHDGPELWVHPGNQHANAEAHRIAGEALFRFLEQRAPLHSSALDTAPKRRAGGAR